MRAPIKLSLHIPNFTYPGVSDDALFERVLEIATTAEASGFDTVTVMDHLHQIQGVGPRTNNMFEGNTMLAALAARTQTVNLGLLVGGVMYRNPALLAKVTTGIDVISRGRAILGIGAAWFEEEHDAYGYPFPPLRERFEHLEDALQIARLMFTEQEPSFTGKHHRIENVLNNPRPLRGDIPIMIGGSGEKKTLRLVAKYADASNVFGDPDRIRHLMGVIDGHCADVGRDPSEITRTGMVQAWVDADGDAARARAKAAGIDEVRAMGVLQGSPDDIAEQAQARIDAGLEGITVVIPDAHDLEKVELVGKTLAPLLP